MKIAFVNGKGGVGKSTLCFLTALGIKEAGKSVSVADLDPQQSISAWIDAERDGISPGQEGGEFTLIDTRPAIEDQSVHDAISLADRIILPCTPSPGDLTALRASLDVVNEFRRGSSKVYVALNCVRPGTNLSKDAPDILRRLGAPVLFPGIPDRQCIQRAILSGWGAMDADTQATVLSLTIEMVS